MDGQKPKTLTKLHTWAHAHKSVLLFCAALTIIIGSGIAVLAIMYQQPVLVPKTELSLKPAAPVVQKFYSALTGVEVPDAATAKRAVTAIMIENSPDARPQSGLKNAGVIFETIAEGGITRFATLFQEAQPGLIGPVRSVRPYYVEWVAAFDTSVAHIGGSSRALSMIRSGNYGVDLDQFFNPGSYWRATDRAAPHNVYTNFERLNALNTAKGHTTSTFVGWQRKTDTPSKTPNATAIDIPISYGDYNVHYNYDLASNSYVRSEGGKPHVDREGGQLAPKVAIVIKDPIVLGFEDGNREQINTVGSGEADIFQDGIITKATWTKTDPKSQISFKDAAGKEISLNRGQTWITIIDPSKAVTWQ